MRNESGPFPKGWGGHGVASALLILLAFVSVSATCSSVPPAKMGTELASQPAPEPEAPEEPVEAVVTPDLSSAPTPPAKVETSLPATTDDHPASYDSPSTDQILPAPGVSPRIPLMEEPYSPFPENSTILAPPESDTAIKLSEPTSPVLPLAPVVEAAPVAPVPEKPLPVEAVVETPKPAVPSQPVPAPASGPKAAVPKTPAPVPKAEPKPEPKPVPKPPQVAPSEPIPAPVEKKSVPLPSALLPELPARTAPIAVEEPVVFSRSIRLSVGQLLEVPFRSAGWVFLGEQGARKGLPYDSRRLDKEGQSFIFRAELEGSYSLKFYRQDFINDYVINDYVQVLVEAPPSGAVVGGFSLPIDRGRVVAEPRWPPTAATSGSATAALASSLLSLLPSNTASEEAGVPSIPVPALSDAIVQGLGAQASPANSTTPVSSKTETAASASTIPKTATTAAAASSPTSVAGVPAVASSSAPTVAAVTGTPRNVRAVADTIKGDAAPEVYFAAARTEGDAGRTDSALAVLDVFLERYPSGSDEGLWLYGHLLEANGPNKDIKSALAFYQRLVQEYPQSPRYDEARKRVAYLERYYFDIR